jgi:hypothetical protein
MNGWLRLYSWKVVNGALVENGCVELLLICKEYNTN